MLKHTSRSLVTIGVQRITLRWKKDEARMARTLQKMYFKQNNTKSKKRFKPQFDLVPRNESALGDVMLERKKRGFTNGQQRRACQVGKVLYDYLVQIINTGELDPYLATNNVEITGVKLIPDFSSMNVYWAATGTQHDEEIEEVLRRNQGKLRHLLTSYHLVSFIPCITFVKDKSLANVRRVEEILNSIDFGPDFTPTTVPIDIVRHQYNIAPPQSVEDKLQQAQISFHENDLLSSVPDTRQNLVRDADNNSNVKSRNNIYGVQHEEIMKNLIIKKSKDKTRPAGINTGFTAESLNLPTSVSKQYNQLAVKLKKPKVEKRKQLLRQVEREYIMEQYKMVQSEKDKLENEHDEEDEENISEEWEDVQNEDYIQLLERFKIVDGEKEGDMDSYENGIHPD